MNIERTSALINDFVLETERLTHTPSIKPIGLAAAFIAGAFALNAVILAVIAAI